MNYTIVVACTGQILAIRGFHPGLEKAMESQDLTLVVKWIVLVKYFAFCLTSYLGGISLQ